MPIVFCTLYFSHGTSYRGCGLNADEAEIAAWDAAVEEGEDGDGYHHCAFHEEI